MSRSKISRNSHSGRSKSRLNQTKSTQLHRNISSKNLASGFIMPNNFVFKFIKKIEPKNIYNYWFSKRGALMALKIVGIGLISGFVLLYILLALYDGKARLGSNNPSNSGNLTIYDSTGTNLIYSEPPAQSTAQENLTSLSQSSRYVQYASIAIEDKNFYHENGVDILAILRSAVHDALSLGRNNIGGSTITEQTVKLDDLQNTNTRTLFAKFSEFFIAIDTNRKYTKQQILTHYLNIAPYGDINGVEAAAKQYFGINASKLTIAESALLASIPRDPTYYAPSSGNPYFDRQATTTRMNYVMKLMLNQGYITKAQYTQALKENPIDIALAQKPVPPVVNLYPNFNSAVIKEINYDQTLSPSNPRYINPSLNIYGLKIVSTLNTAQQQYVDNAFTANTTTNTRFPGTGASENIFINHLNDEAFVAENVPTGQITALVGSFNEQNPSDTSNFSIRSGSTYTSNGNEYGISTRNGKTVQINSFSSLNCATNQECVQPGSSFKLYDYSALINDPSVNNGSGAGAGSVLYDVPGLITCTTKCAGTQTPANLGWACGQTSNNNCLQDDTGPAEMYGPVTLRYGLGNSLNIPAVKAGAIEGKDNNGVWKAINVADNMMGTNFVNGNKINDYVCIVNNPATGGPEINSQGNYVYSAQACISGEPLIGDQAQISLIDHVNGYATAARLGAEIPYTTILSIINPTNNKVLFKYTKPQAAQVINQQTEYIMMNMLSDHNASYMASILKDGTGWNISYKSGTQFEQYNGLVMAASTQYAVGMWVGCPDHCVQNPTCNDGSAGNPVYLPCGATQQMEFMTVPIVKNFMLNIALKNLKVSNWTAPTGIQTLPAYCQTKRINSDIPPSNCTNYTDIYPSWYKQSQAAKGGIFDKVSGELATTCTPSLAKVTVGASSNVSIYSIDPFYTVSLTGQQSTVNLYDSSKTDSIHLCSDSMPKVTLESASSCASGTCTFNIVITTGTHPLSSTQFPLQVNAIISGQPITATCSNFSQDPTSTPPLQTSATCTFSFNTPGTTNLTVEAIDSVLDTSDPSNALPITVPPVIDGKITPNVTTTTTTLTVTWTQNGTDTYTCEFNKVAATLTPTSNGFSCTSPSYVNGSNTPVSINITDQTNSTQFTKDETIN